MAVISQQQHYCPTALPAGQLAPIVYLCSRMSIPAAAAAPSYYNLTQVYPRTAVAHLSGYLSAILSTGVADGGHSEVSVLVLSSTDAVPSIYTAVDILQTGTANGFTVGSVVRLVGGGPCTVLALVVLAGTTTLQWLVLSSSDGSQLVIAPGAVSTLTYPVLPVQVS